MATITDKVLDHSVRVFISSTFRDMHAERDHFAKGQLGKGHDHKLVPAAEAPGAPVALIARDALVEFVLGKKLEKLSKDELLGLPISPHSASWRCKDDINAFGS